MMESKNEPGASALLRVLTLDGGGAKGFYTLGVLKEIEAMIGCPLHQKFDLVFGTSTGAIIASLIALGHGVDSILELYRKHVPTVMSQKTAPARSQALKKLASRPCKIHLAAPTRSAGRARVASRLADAASADSSQSERKKAGAMPRRAMARSSQRMLKPAAHNTACSASPSAPLSQQRFMP